MIAAVFRACFSLLLGVFSVKGIYRLYHSRTYFEILSSFVYSPLTQTIIIVKIIQLTILLRNKNEVIDCNKFKIDRINNLPSMDIRRIQNFAILFTE